MLVSSHILKEMLRKQIAVLGSEIGFLHNFQEVERGGFSTSVKPFTSGQGQQNWNLNIFIKVEVFLQNLKP
jgi:hypothetical protein